MKHAGYPTETRGGIYSHERNHLSSFFGFLKMNKLLVILFITSVSTLCFAKNYVKFSIIWDAAVPRFSSK